MGIQQQEHRSQDNWGNQSNEQGGLQILDIGTLNLSFFELTRGGRRKDQHFGESATGESATGEPRRKDQITGKDNSRHQILDSLIPHAAILAS